MHVAYLWKYTCIARHNYGSNNNRTPLYSTDILSHESRPLGLVLKVNFAVSQTHSWISTNHTMFKSITKYLLVVVLFACLSITIFIQVEKFHAIEDTVVNRKTPLTS